MSPRKLLALVTVFGGAVAGCATGPDPGEPVVVMDQLTCVEAAEVAGMYLGNREVRIVNPVPSHYHLSDVPPLSVEVRASSAGVHLEWSGSLGVHGVIVERVVGRAAELDQVEPDSVAVMPRDHRSHLEWADELGAPAEMLDRRFELYLRDPAMAGPTVIPASLHPRTKHPLDLAAFRVCLDR